MKPPCRPPQRAELSAPQGCGASLAPTQPTKGATHLFCAAARRTPNHPRGAGEGNARGGAGAERLDPRYPRGGTRQGKGDGARPAARRPPPAERPRWRFGSAIKGREIGQRSSAHGRARKRTPTPAQNRGSLCCENGTTYKILKIVPFLQHKTITIFTNLSQKVAYCRHKTMVLLCYHTKKQPVETSDVELARVCGKLRLRPTLSTIGERGRAS